MPTEDWYEPVGCDGYQIHPQPPGDGFVHAVTSGEVRDRLALLPSQFLETLEVVQLSQMTRKKKTFPCYGMQWGPTLYLYPVNEGLIEYFYRPPRPAEIVEATMFGAKWRQESSSMWLLEWTAETIRDFYLNNVLIHELGHLLDSRNTSYVDRERYAEWFAIKYGYQPSRRQIAAKGVQRILRRHHGQ